MTTPVIKIHPFRLWDTLFTHTCYEQCPMPMTYDYVMLGRVFAEYSQLNHIVINQSSLNKQQAYLRSQLHSSLRSAYSRQKHTIVINGSSFNKQQAYLRAQLHSSLRSPMSEAGGGGDAGRTTEFPMTQIGNSFSVQLLLWRFPIPVHMLTEPLMKIE